MYAYDTYIAHYGIKGQKWGIRRFQNEDGSLTNSGKKRYSSFTTRRYAKKAEKYKAKAEEVSKSKNQDVKDKRYGYELKQKEYSQRAIRSQQFDDRYAKELSDRNNAKSLVTGALVGMGTYDAYIRHRAAGIDKGRAIVRTFLGGNLSAEMARRNYINQDVKKDREDQKAKERASRKFNTAAYYYIGARSSRNKADRERWEKSGDRLRNQGLSELEKRNLGYNDMKGHGANTVLAKKNFDYKKDRDSYNYYRRW